VRRDRKRTQLAVEGILSVLLLISIGTLFYLLFGPIWQAWSSRPPLPPVEQPENVGALVTKLKTIRPLRELDPKPTSCGHVPKGRQRDRCSYRAGDIDVIVVWARRSVDRISVRIQKTEPRASMPFAWADLPDTIRLLCGIGAEDANAFTQETRAELERAPWYRQGEKVTTDTDGAFRSASRGPDEACSFELNETVTGSKVSAQLWVKRVSAD
jgi:hypothetical protein